jgi:hypothetical protein
MPFLSPFAFRDRAMESNYQHHFYSSNFDRFKAVMRLIFPIVMILRMYPILCWFLAYSVDSIELFEAAYKMIGIVCLGIVFSKSWSDSAKTYFGLLFSWMIRAGWLQAAVGQTRGLNHSQAMTSFVTMVCLGGLMIPNISEYFILALLVSYIRPIRLAFMMVQDPDAELVTQAFYQHTLVLGLGVSIAWAFHGDFRRDWLRSPAACVKPSKQRKKLTSVRSPTPRTDDKCFDELDDDYFTESDRAELMVEVLKVSVLVSRQRGACSDIYRPLSSSKVAGRGRVQSPRRQRRTPRHGRRGSHCVQATAPRLPDSPSAHGLTISTQSNHQHTDRPSAYRLIISAQIDLQYTD